MKKISLKTHTQTASLYNVTLGNGAHHEFKSNKKLLSFLNKANTELTKLLYDTNLLYSQLFSLYRLNWGLFSNHFAGNNPKYIKSNNTIKQLINSIELNFDNVVFKSHHLNGSYFLFHHFNVLLNDLYDFVIILIDLTKKHSFTPIAYQLDSIRTQIIQIKKLLNNYSLDSCVKIIDLSRLSQLQEFSYLSSKIKLVTG